MARPTRTKTKDLSSLRAVPLFAALNLRELELIYDLSISRQVKAGTVIIREGGRGDEFFVIQSGRAQVSKANRTIAELADGDHFGELALLSRSSRRATVTAVTDATLLVLSRWAFMGLLGQIPDMAIKLLKSAAERLRETQRVPID